MSGWETLGRGVWAVNYASLDLNVGAVAGDDGLLVVDTRSHRGEAAELRRDLAELGAGPVRWVVNTHCHFDHSFGNAAFRPAPIWGHRRCAAELRSNEAEHRAAARRYLPHAAAEVDATEIVPPDEIVEHAAGVDLGARVVEVRHLGRGHTDGDVVVIVPDAGVLFAGDLLENGAPPAFDDAYPLDWPETARRLVDLAAGTVVPGHGKVGGLAFATAQQADLAAAAAVARAAHAAGHDVAAEPPPGPFPPDTMRILLQRAYLQLAGDRP